MIYKIILCTMGSAAFAVTMKAPKNVLPLIIIGAVISAATEITLSSYYGEFFACLAAMICLTFYCEATARILKTPATVILLPAMIPLLPGSSIYYTMFYAIQSNKKLFTEYAESTFLAGLGIALGAVISSTVINIINYYRKG